MADFTYTPVAATDDALGGAEGVGVPNVQFSQVKSYFVANQYRWGGLLGCGRLSWVSATQLKFGPFNGNAIPVKTSGVWKLRDIPSGGITAANTGVFVNGASGQNLAASTEYLVTLFDNSGTLTIDFIPAATGHSTDTSTGIEIKTGDDTRILIGRVHTNGASQFADNATSRLVASWLNRTTRGGLGSFTADRTTVSTTYVELNAEIRVEFLAWADESVQAMATGYVTNSAAGNKSLSAIAFDGTTAEVPVAAAMMNASGGAPATLAMVKNGLAEGYHYLTLLGRVTAGTGTWQGTPSPEVTTVQVAVRL